MLLILLGAVLGFVAGGPVGLLVGGALGWWIGRRLRRGVAAARREAQTRFLDSAFAVMGCLCQADGQVSDEELDVAERLFDRLKLGGDQRDRARAAFARGREKDFDLDAELARVRQLTHGQVALRLIFLQVQLSAIAADGELHSAEHEMMLRVARGLGCSEAEVDQVEAMLHGAASASRGADEEALADAYRVLGVAPDASDAELKKAYRRLMSQNHPDKIAGKGLPESMREIAQARTSEIGNAYERIRQARAGS